MALIRRVSRLFTADLHAVLDRLEEPEALLKQAIREMDEELARQTQRARNFRQERSELDARLAETVKSLGELDARLDLCFDAGNEALGKQVTRRKLETRRFKDRLEAKRASLEQALAELEAAIAANRDRLEGMRQKAEVFCTGVESGCDEAAEWPRCGVDDTEVELAYLKEQQARSAS